MQNNYESPMLNEWDGSFKIDESNSTIMSMMLGAGLKDENNQFSGVLMGNLAITELMDGKNVIDQNKSMVGLYGFRQG
jgi:phosphoribosylamine-glycine ligase